MAIMQPSFTVASSDGVSIAAYEHGAPADCPSHGTILICHATGFCGPMYDDIAIYLTRHFRVVSIDFRGHGRSSRPANDDFGWHRMTDDLLAVVDHLHDGGATGLHGIGHSMGGAALLFGELRRPGTFRSFYLYEPIVVPDGAFPANAPNMLADGARLRRPVFATRAEALQRYASRPPLNQLRASVLTAYVDNGFLDQPDGTVRLACLPDDEARTFESPDKLSVSSTATIVTPTVIATGHDEPGPNPARFAPMIAATMPNAHMLTHATMGHFGPFQDPLQIATEIAAHIATVA